MAAAAAEAVGRASRGGAKPRVAAAAEAKGHGEPSGPMSGTKTAVLFGGRRARVPADRPFAPPSFLGHFTVFVLACFVGYMVVGT
jgi:NAD(P) transhydrogenase subunit alpha